MHSGTDFTRTAPPRASRRKGLAFTLVELLVVIAIIAMLVAMISPTVTRARELAQRAVCATNMSNLGKLLQGYSAEYNSYPHFSPWVWQSSPQMMWEDGSFTHELDGWPEIYGLLEFNGIKGTRKTAWGNWYYGNPINQIWSGATCASVDLPKILDLANKSGNDGFNSNPMYWVWYHPWAASFQWNAMTRARTKQPPYRYKVNLHELDWQTEPDMWQWTQPWAFLKVGTNPWVSHAISPSEVMSPARVAEAWDGFDPESAPNIDWGGDTVGIGAQFLPGWSPGTTHAGSTVIVNGYRHKGSPNILYSDASVRADARHAVDPVGLGMAGRYAGATAQTWEYDDDKLGTYFHLVPRTKLP
jgi:prepilin-type N-terminal cleavage/methylation domain-containing protein